MKGESDLLQINGLRYDGFASARLAFVHGHADCDERLHFPIVRKEQCFTYGVRAKQRRAHPACAETERVRQEQQVLHGHGDALNGHRSLGKGAPLVGIAIHVAHRQAGDDDKWGVHDTLVRALHVPLDGLRWIPVTGSISPKAVAHCRGQPPSGFEGRDDGEAPRLAVVRRWRPRRRFQEPLDSPARNGVGAIAADGAARADQGEQSVRELIDHV